MGLPAAVGSSLAGLLGALLPKSMLPAERRWQCFVGTACRNDCPVANRGPVSQVSYSDTISSCQSDAKREKWKEGMCFSTPLEQSPVTFKML